MSAIGKYAHKRFGTLAAQLKNYSVSPDSDTLHGIRVEVKKIKSLLRLMEFSLKRFNGHKHFKPLREIFRKAGRVRDLDVFYQLLLRYEISGIEDAVVPQSRKEVEFHREFMGSIPRFLKVVEKSKKKLDKHYHKIESRQLKVFLKERKKEVRSKLQGPWKPNPLHKTRKVIKEIIYISAIDGKLKKLDPFYPAIEKAIGLWHDKQMILPVLRKSNHSEITRIKSESQRDMKLIRKLIAEFYKG